ncbi:hypothetical protein B4U80_12388, partial [Leptotrombidium deliense]
ELAKLIGVIYNLSNPLEIILVSGAKFIINQTITATVKYENSSVELQFYVIRGFAYPVLLGVDWCRASKVRIDFGNENESYIDEGWIPVPHVKPLVTCERTDIELSSMLQVKSLQRRLVQFHYNPTEQSSIQTYDVDETDRSKIEAKQKDDGTLNIFLSNNLPYAVSMGTEFIVHKPMITVLNNFNIDENKNQFKIGLQLLGEQKRRILDVLQNNSDLFVNDTKHLTQTNRIEMVIDTGEELPIYKHPYKVSEAERIIIDNQIKEMIEANVIEPCNGPWAMPVVLVRKKNGKWRFCVDYRPL